MTGQTIEPFEVGSATHLPTRLPDNQSSEAQLQRTAVAMIVDDEPINIKVVQKYLRSHGYEHFVAVEDSRHAIPLLLKSPPDVLLLDVMMPHVGGFEILRAVRADPRLQHLPVLILTAATDEETRLHALELGATDFLQKPVKPSELVPRVRNAIVMKSRFDKLSRYSEHLEQEVRQRTAELAKAREELIHVLGCAAEYRDHETGDHVRRVGKYCAIIARQLGFSHEQIELLEQAAVLHDVGKIGIPDAILLKPGKLTVDEMEVMRHHCNYGMRILMGLPSVDRDPVHKSNQLIESPVLRLAAKIALSHHEKWDGSGYPNRLAGEEIPIEGRIVAVADVFDALGSRRPYKEAMPLMKCLEILELNRGTHFDPRVLDAFLSSLDDIIKVSCQLGD